MSLVDAIEKKNWKDPDEWLKEIKMILSELTTKVTILWIPSHCSIAGNDQADDLAKQGFTMPQENTPVSVTHKSVKAKIMGRKWQIKHARAKETYGNRLGPKIEVEKTWPRKVRTLYSRLRTVHDMELAYYRYKINKEDDPFCKMCEDEHESIKHVLCNFPDLEMERRRLFEGEEVGVSYLVSESEKCRRLLTKRFERLKNTVRSPFA